MYSCFRFLVDLTIYGGFIFDILYMISMTIANKSTDNFLIIMTFGCVKILFSMLVGHKHIRISTIICIFIKFLIELVAIGFSCYLYETTKDLLYIGPIILQFIVCSCILVYLYNFDKWTKLTSEYYWCDKHIESCQQCICSICLESYHDDMIYNLSCNHNFHKECLDDWLKQKKNCPLCRVNIYIE